MANPSDLVQESEGKRRKLAFSLKIVQFPDVFINFFLTLSRFLSIETTEDK